MSEDFRRRPRWTSSQNGQTRYSPSSVRAPGTSGSQTVTDRLQPTARCPVRFVRPRLIDLQTNGPDINFVHLHSRRGVGRHSSVIPVPHPDWNRASMPGRRRVGIRRRALADVPRVVRGDAPNTSSHITSDGTDGVWGLRVFRCPLDSLPATHPRDRGETGPYPLWGYRLVPAPPTLGCTRPFPSG